jgi:hypothetical protein
MNSESFTYWLQGFVELSESDAVPNEKQWLMIKDHLKLVFDKKTPDRVFEIKPSINVGDGADYKRLSDLIGKKAEDTYWKWPDAPPVFTC